jgi:hypothetical protein
MMRCGRDGETEGGRRRGGGGWGGREERRESKKEVLSVCDFFPVIFSTLLA